MQPNTQAQKPFFAQFLENQAPQQETAQPAQTADNKMTLKFPSDKDEEDL